MSPDNVLNDEMEVSTQSKENRIQDITRAVAEILKGQFSEINRQNKGGIWLIFFLYGYVGHLVRVYNLLAANKSYYLIFR